MRAFPEKNAKILVVGHDDVVERSLTRRFREEGYQPFSSTESRLETTRQDDVERFFSQNRPDYVFLGSTRSGSIAANQQNPGEFIYHNLASATNVIHAACRFNVKKVIYVASSCVYPARARQPLKEEYLLTGAPEVSNEAYSVAKIAGIKMCQAYRAQHGLNAVAVVPATLYGPGDVSDGQGQHVLDALIRRFSDATQKGDSEVMVWGSGRPRREFLFIDDFVDALIFLLNEYNGGDLLNVGCGSDIAIKDLAGLISRICGFTGRIVFDRSKPDGVARKLLDTHRMTALGWKPKVGLEEGIQKTLDSLKGNY